MAKCLNDRAHDFDFHLGLVILEQLGGADETCDRCCGAVYY